MKGTILAVIALVFAVIFPLAGLIVGIVVLARAKGKDEGRGLALAAVVISSLWLLLLLFIFAMIFFGSFTRIMTPVQ